MKRRYMDPGYRNPQHLAKLAWSAFVNNGFSGQKSADKIMDCIERLLTERRDDVLFRACDEAEEKYGDMDLVHFMLDMIRDCAQSRSVKDGFVDLFAIPIHVHGDDAWRACEIVAPDSFNALAKSFRQTGLIGAGPSLMLLPQLFTASQVLSMSWSDVRNDFVGGCLHALAKNKAWAPVKPEGETPPALIGTRFLVGAVVSSNDEAIPFLTDHADDESMKLEDNQIELWLKEAEPLVSSAFGIKKQSAMVGIPMAYFGAISIGLPQGGILALEAAVEALERNGISKRGLRAVTSYHDMASGLREVRIAIESMLDGVNRFSVAINLPPLHLCDQLLADEVVSDAIVGSAGTIVSIDGDGVLDDMLCHCGGGMVFHSSGEFFCPACDAEFSIIKVPVVPYAPSKSSLH